MPAAKKQAKILIIDDEKDVHYSFERLLAKEPVQVLSADTPAKGLKILEDELPEVVVMDIRMGRENGLDGLAKIREFNPKQVVIMMTAYGTSQTAIEAMKRGAFDYILKPFDILELKALIKRGLDAAEAAEGDVPETAVIDVDTMKSGIVGTSAPMQKVYKLIGQVSPTDATVLIQGESGTGKEVVARAIYQNSNRANKTFITINCAAIPENLLESELFGHEKGSFTGAMAQRIGKFEQCDGGTIFLDEIGEMPLPIQSKLLRVIQEGEFTRVGGNKPIYTDVRLIAATNRDLAQASNNREFREDLYYRLNVVSIDLPPLRSRKEDIPSLVAFFIKKWKQRNPEGPASISPEALEALTRLDWPGNVRELENSVQRAMVLASGDTLTPGDIVTDQQVLKSNDSASLSWESVMEELFVKAELEQEEAVIPLLEKMAIEKALQRTGGDEAKSAKLLGLTKSALLTRIEKYQIQV
ncbi:MAG: sigma-54 dependent transcriptional regulator [Verrucomicrobiota bacterium]